MTKGGYVNCQICGERIVLLNRILGKGTCAACIETERKLAAHDYICDEGLWLAIIGGVGLFLSLVLAAALHDLTGLCAGGMMFAASAIAVRLGLRWNRKQSWRMALLRRNAQAQLPIPQYITASGAIRMRGGHEFPLGNHTVSDPLRALQTFVRPSLVELGVNTVVGIIATAVFYILWRLTSTLELSLQVPHLVKVPISLLSILFVCGVVGSLPCCLFKGLRALWSASVRPDLSLPELSVRFFLRAIRASLPERAYNLLTDQARILGSFNLGESFDAVTQALPPVTISDTASFGWWWTGVKFTSWKPVCDECSTYTVAPDVAVVVVPISARLDMSDVGFKAAFTTVRRHDQWFVATPFMWPCNESAEPTDSSSAKGAAGSGVTSRQATIGV